MSTEKTEETLSKGTVVKLRGFPLELTEDVKVIGHVEKEDEATQSSLASSLETTRSSDYL